MSKVSALYHIVFCTKNRQDTVTKAFKEDLYRFIWAEIRGHGCKLIRIGGIENHLHMLIDLHPAVSLSDLMKEIKSRSSGWMRQDLRFHGFDGWAKEYFAATVAAESMDAVINYINNQELHHGATTLEQEFGRMYSAAGLSYHAGDMQD